MKALLESIEFGDSVKRLSKYEWMVINDDGSVALQSFPNGTDEMYMKLCISGLLPKPDIVTVLEQRMAPIW